MSPFADPATAVQATISGVPAVITNPGSQVTPSGQTGWADLPLISMTGVATPGGAWLVDVSKRAGVLVKFRNNGTQAARILLGFSQTSGGALTFQTTVDVRGNDTTVFFASVKDVWLNVSVAVFNNTAQTADLYVYPTDRPLIPGSYLDSLAHPGPAVINTGFMSVAANASSAYQYQNYPYWGPATIALYSDAPTNLGLVYVEQQDYLATATNILLWAVGSPGRSFFGPIFLPPRILRVLFQNNDAAAHNFLCQITPGGPR